jgi:GNAT superfamily N-acetyltransferase
MRIESNDDRVPWNRVSELFRLVGWGLRDPDELRSAFRKSTFKAFAYEGDKLVGFGRTIDDGRFYATIVDVVVDPEYQRKGVGASIVRDLQGRLRGFVIVNLTAAPGVEPFYRRLGWRRQKTAMMLPRSSEQAIAHCEDDDG